MRALSFAAVVIALAACTPADPASQLAQNWRICESGGLPDARVAACSSVIASRDAQPGERARALLNRGILRADLGQHARAVADFGLALRIDPNFTDALVERGIVHQTRGAMDRALADYQAALALDPYQSLARERLRVALEERADAYLRQIQTLNEALASDPNNVSLLNNRCWTRAVSEEDLAAARADCDAALRVEPTHAAALDSRGLVNLKQGDFQAALADYEAALAQEPRRGHYLYGRGLARIGLDQTEEGQADLVTAEALEPGVTRAYASYAAAPERFRAGAAPKPIAAQP